MEDKLINNIQLLVIETGTSNRRVKIFIRFRFYFPLLPKMEFRDDSFEFLKIFRGCGEALDIFIYSESKLIKRRFFCESDSQQMADGSDVGFSEQSKIIITIIEEKDTFFRSHPKEN